MNLILCHPQDKDAIWLYLELKKVNAKVHLLSPEQLLMAENWTQFLETDEDSFYIKTKSGIEIDSKEKHFVLNRTQMVHSPIWSHADADEKNYAFSELNAMFMSWIFQLQKHGVVWNPTIGYSLSGAPWSEIQWIQAAHQVGFEKARPRSSEPFDSYLVVSKKVICDISNKKNITMILELARKSNTPLLEVYVSKDGSGFLGANSFPNLQRYGKKIVSLINHEMA